MNPVNALSPELSSVRLLASLLGKIETRLERTGTQRLELDKCKCRKQSHDQELLKTSSTDQQEPMSCSLFAFGSNGNGQLGIGFDEDTSSPLPVQFDPHPTLSHPPLTNHHQHPTIRHPPFLDFAAGGNHTALITRDHQLLYMTGSNKDSESLLDEPAQVFTRLPTMHTEPSSSSAVSFKKTAQHESEDQTPTRWRSVACGWAFTIAVTEPESGLTDKAVNTSIEADVGHARNHRNKVYTWGSGAFGELGLGPRLTKTGRRAIEIKGGTLNSLERCYEILKVRAGLRHVLLLVREQSNSDTRTMLIGWGSNRQGQLGVLTRQHDGGNEAPLTDKELRGKFMEPTLIMIPRDSSDPTTPVPEITDMACGQNHSLVLLSDGSVYSSGLNKYGQLGPMNPSSIQRQDFRIGFEKVHGLPFVDSISCGWNHNAAMDTRPLYEKGRTIIYLWGRNDHGQLGNGVPVLSVDTDWSGSNTVPLGVIVQVQIPTAHDGAQDENEEIISYSCGSEHTLAMTRSGDCYAWGWNEHGNCGSGHDATTTTMDLRDVPAPRKVQFLALSSSQSPASDSGQGWVLGGYGSSWVWT